MSRLTAGIRAASLTVAVAVAAAGCTVDPVSPLPTEAAPAAASATPLRSASAAIASPAPASPAPASPAPASATSAAASPSKRGKPTVPPRTSPPESTQAACQGAVVHTIDVATDELALVRALCLGAGAVLRIENIGPGEVTIDAPALVDPTYEAGIVEIRFLRAGTVVVTIPQQGKSYDVTVVVR